MQIVDLGTAFGPPDARHVTTFTDSDSIGSDALHSAYESSVTLVGLAAGLFKLLRDPHLVQALLLRAEGKPLTEHLISVWEVQLAAVFGDRATVDAAHALMRRTHSRSIPTEAQADWFKAAVGRRRSYSLGSPRLMWHIFAATCGPAARAHHLNILGWSGEERIYMDELASSFGYACGLDTVGLPDTIEELCTRDPAYVEQLLGREQLTALGLNDLSSFAEMVILPDGRKIGELLRPIVALLDADDIAAHGLEDVDPQPSWFTLDRTFRLPHLTVSYRGAPPPTK